MLQAIIDVNPNSDFLYVVDTRPKVGGGGGEGGYNYSLEGATELKFASFCSS